MSVRKYDFIVGPETDTLPTVEDPVSSDDFFSLGYAEKTYAHVEFWGDAVQSVQNLKDIGPTLRFDKQTRWLDDKKAHYVYDSADSQANDDDLVIEPTDTPANGRWLKIETGGGAGGGGSQWSTGILGEPILATDVPCAVYPAVKPTLIVTLGVNDKIDIAEIGDVVITLDAGTYRFDTDYERAKFLSMVAGKLNAAGGLAGTYTVSFDKATRKITISSTASFTLKNNTGANAGTSAAVLLMGWSGASDTPSATSTTADNEIDGFFTNKMLWFKTDANYIEYSLAYQGIVETSGAQFDSKDIKYNQSLLNFSGLTEGDELYTAKGSITIDATNKDLDFAEGGPELNAVLTEGEFVWDGTTSHGGLAENIKAAMEAVGAGVYTVVYDLDTDKWSITKDSGTFSLPFATGTNNATSPAAVLGFTATDHGAASTQTSDNALANRGQLVNGSSFRLTTASVGAGVAEKAAQVQAKRFEGQAYIEVVNLPGAWLASPVSETFSGDVALADSDEAPSGNAIRVVRENSGVAASEQYRIQYKLSASANWQTSATLIGGADDSTVSGIDGLWQNGSVLEFHAKVAIDYDNPLKAVVAFTENVGGNFRLYAYHTTNGGVTWAQSTGTSTGSSLLASGTNWIWPGSIAIRAGKCVVLGVRDDSALAQIFVSDDGGSGYTTFGAGVSPSTTNYHAQIPVALFIQYFPAETGVNKHRIVAFGTNPSATTPLINYWKGDGTGAGQITVTNWNNIHVHTQAVAIERSGSGNRLVAVYGNDDGITTAVGLVSGYSNDTYNGGVLTFTDSLTDLTSGLTPITDKDQGNTDDPMQGSYGIKRKLLVINGKGYLVATLGIGAGDTTPHINLYKSNDVTTNVWTLVGQIDGGTAGVGGQIVFLPAKNKLITAWKELTTTANHATEGQIWSRTADIEGNEVYLRAAGQVDGGQPVAGVQGFPKISASADGASIMFNRGTTDATLYWNKFI